MTNIIVEDLTATQKKHVNSWKKTANAVDISKHVIPAGHDRITIPLDDPADTNIRTPDLIKNHFDTHGIEVHDYAGGYVKDKYKRIMKLGKALVQTNAHPSLAHHFNTDPARAAAKLHGNLQVVISRHPYDVAGMSTNRGWTSCMSMVDGEHKHYLHKELKNGTHVAYLTQKGDDDVKNPVARIALKPYSNEDKTHHILRPDDSQYGTSASSFEHTVHGWAAEHFPLKEEQLYHKAAGSYHDGDLESSVIAPKITDDMVKRHLRGVEHAYGDVFATSGHAVAERKEAVIQHISKYGNESQRHMIVDHFINKKAGMNYGIGSNLAQHGTHELHQKMLVHLPHGNNNTGHMQGLIAYGSDQIKHQMLRDPNAHSFNNWDAHKIVTFTEPTDTTEYARHPNSNVRAALARQGKHHDILKNDLDYRVLGAVVRRTNDKKVFDHILTHRVKEDHIKHKYSKQSEYGFAAPAEQGEYNEHFGHDHAKSMEAIETKLSAASAVKKRRIY